MFKRKEPKREEPTITRVQTATENEDNNWDGDVLPPLPPPPTERRNTPPPRQERVKEPDPAEERFKAIAAYFEANYAGAVSVGPDHVRADLLFAVFGELVQLNDELRESRVLLELILKESRR